MSFLEDNCTFIPFSEELSTSCNPFDCEHNDLNDFFKNDCINYSKELLGKTYCFVLDKDPKTIVCIFTISNESIRTNLIPKASKNKINRKVPYVKQRKSYPAVLIGRLGVNKDFKKAKIGTELMNFVKSWFIADSNKTGCRFIVVDSYNESIPLSYYKKNGFELIFKDENEEKKYMNLPYKTSKFHFWKPAIEDVKLETRLMYFDLIVLRK